MVECLLRVEKGKDVKKWRLDFEEDNLLLEWKLFFNLRAFDVEANSLAW